MLKKSFILIFIFSHFFSFAYADSATTLSQLLKNMHSMQANFSQSVIDKKGKVMQRSTGRMALQRPSQFRWDTQRPTKQLVVTNGRRLWIYDPDLEQVTIRSLSKAAGETPAMLLSDSDLRLEKEFTVTSTSSSSSTQWFLLIPKDRSAVMASLKLGFSGQVIREMILQDHLGHITAIRFNNVKINSTLPASLFNFNPPARVDVINETK